MDTREQILQVSGNLLSRIGPSAMTMDMVAHSCGISKRTLYETFPDKKSLIMESLRRDHEKQDMVLQQIFATADNCFDALFKVFTHVRKYLQSTPMTFINELKRLYPEIHEKHKAKEKDFVMGLSQVLQKAQTEGHVMQDIDTRIAAFLFMTTMRNLNENDRLNDYGFDAVKVFEGAFLNFLRGIATIEGIQFIDDFIHNQDNIKNL
ncbi:MAG: TetR/AcrR family transcriptional regulator [Muribaculaceae bacterium]|nr:TetR/AcrR family transcriptional regulator [Muribaculaceae bacterium]